MKQQDDLIAQHAAAIAKLEAKHKTELQAQKDSWIKAQKVQTCVAGEHYGTVWELERRGIITTSVDPDGWVVWELAESASSKAHPLHI